MGERNKAPKLPYRVERPKLKWLAGDLIGAQRWDIYPILGRQGKLPKRLNLRRMKEQAGSR
jgi:hypothetical protein